MPQENQRGTKKKWGEFWLGILERLQRDYMWTEPEKRCQIWTAALEGQLCRLRRQGVLREWWVWQEVTVIRTNTVRYFHVRLPHWNWRSLRTEPGSCIQNQTPPQLPQACSLCKCPQILKDPVPQGKEFGCYSLVVSRSRECKEGNCCICILERVTWRQYELEWGKNLWGKHFLQ